MALKQDERALIQLVCERGQSYEDLAGLLGISEDEVRAKARSALTELGGADPDAEVGLTDYLLGQADPIGRADAVRYLQQDAEARDLAEAILTRITAIAPNATLPSLPEPKGRRRKAASTAGTADSATTVAKPADDASDRPSLSSSGTGGGRQSALIAGLAAGGLILVVVILFVAGVFSSDDDDGGSDAPSPEAEAAESQRTITPVELTAENDSGVAGQADFGLANDQLFIDLAVNGLDPRLDRDSVYVVWMMLNDQGGYPVSIVIPNENGSVQERYAVPTPVAVAIGSNARSVRISESPRKALEADINVAVEEGAPIVPFSGEALASGNIPLAEGAGADTGAGGDQSAQPETP
jgi:transposase-like protein